MAQDLHIKHMMRQAKGFTLLELMIVIAVLGILAAVAIPNFVSQMPKYRLNGAARQVMGDLMWARMQAVSLNRRVKVFFLSNNHEYKICDDADNNGTVADGEGDVQLKDIHNEYHDVTIGSNNDPIFSPRGTATNLPTITLTNPSGSKTITISIAGRVSIS